MRIGAFFKNRLNAPLQHIVQSWGATNANTGNIFFRIGKWAVSDYDDGYTWVVLYHPDWSGKKHGEAQRLQHIESMRNSTPAFAVVLEFNEHGRIKSFDDENLLRLGEPVDENGFVYARVEGVISVDNIAACLKPGSSASDDVIKISTSSGAITERSTLVSARLGQGKFRSMVLRHWSYRCALTGVSTGAVIRASHIRPWRDSSNRQRLDPYNGLPLAATIDALFDAGDISFTNNGRILISSRISEHERDKLGIHTQQSIGKVPAKTKKYLNYHRSNVFDRVKNDR